MEGGCGRKGGVWAITLDLHDRPSLDSRARVLFVFVVHAMHVRGNSGWVKHIPPHACRLTVQVCDATATLEKISGVKVGSAISLAAGATRALKPAAGNNSVLHHSVLD